MSDATGLSERLDALRLSQVVAGSAMLLSVLQGALAAAGGPWDVPTIAALLLAGLCLFVASRFLTTGDSGLLAAVLILFAAQLALFGVRLAGTIPPLPLPLLQVAIVLASLATLLVALLAGTRLTKPINAVVLAATLAAGLFLVETGFRLFSHPPASTRPVPEWGGKPDSHPIIGWVHHPYSVLTTFYPDNPRGYFEAEDPRAAPWHLELQLGANARMEFPAELPEGVRVAIEKSNPDTTWLIQLEQPHLRVERGVSYSIQFRARADRPRSIEFGLAQAHVPWTNLGLYQRVELTQEWQSFQGDLTAKATDSDARIHLNLGGSEVPVEVSALSLRGADNRVIPPAVPPQRFQVRYVFNALGCRGRDYPLSRTDGTTRILVLGDSYTLGVGVHQEDTFSAKLERALQQDSANAGAARRSYEVINCGVSGYGTKEERLFYELYGARYRPDLVLLMMVFNDDMSVEEEVRKGYVNRRPGKLELLFHELGKVQEYRHRHTYDYTQLVEEIRQLEGEVRQQGARLVVGSFGSSPDSAQDQLTLTVTRGLAGTDIPILDLGKVLNHYTPHEALIVHPRDGHPNELAHTIVARELLTFLRAKGLLER